MPVQAPSHKRQLKRWGKRVIGHWCILAPLVFYQPGLLVWARSLRRESLRDAAHDGVPFGEAPPLSDRCQGIRLRPCDIAGNPDRLGPACHRKQKKSTCRRLRRCQTSLDVEGRSLMRKWRRRLCTFSVFSRCDNRLLALPDISSNATCNDRLLSVTHWAAGGCAQTSWDTSKMDIVTAVGFWKAQTFTRSLFVRSPSDSRARSPMGWDKCGRQDLHPSRGVSPWVFNLLAFLTIACISLCSLKNPTQALLHPLWPCRWRTRRPSCGSPSWGTAGTTRRSTVSPTFATHSSSTPTNTWETRRD